MTEVAEIALGGDHSCARLTDDTVKCWGLSNTGQLNDGTHTERGSPTPVPGLTEVVELDVDSYNSCAWLGDGTVKCWGDTQAYQIDQNDSGYSLTPMEVTW